MGQIMQTPLFKALVALLFGSFGTPIIYVAVGFIYPRGFHDLRGVAISTILIAFGVSWVFSAFMTVLVGGVLWKPLHLYGYDSAITYSFIAVLAYILLGVISGAGLWGWFGLCMCVANALAIRMVECNWSRVCSAW